MRMYTKVRHTTLPYRQVMTADKTDEHMPKLETAGMGQRQSFPPPPQNN